MMKTISFALSLNRWLQGSLDESAPTTYLDELDARAKFRDPEGFQHPQPKKIGAKNFFKSAINSIKLWRNGQGKSDDGVEL